MKLNHLVLLGALMTGSGACRAHKDRIITVSAQGAMADIPAEFGPARLEVVFAAPGGKPPVGAVTLWLGGHMTVLPACIVALLPSRQMAHLSATASWYHDENGSLPYYLGIKFAAPKANAERQIEEHVSMLFNLRTARLISIDKVMADPRAGSEHSSRLQLEQRCSPLQLDAVFDPATAFNAR
ncbi:hypothetical protein [Massilia scottii]|uniref:hypothetical protein n=1 Tax=Massilia scottii TaxID=3057166 RepID=UPI002796D17F|nr:hypothetical protein [Massilia sp. CCM 9029]MDQ1834793.1 hypothetical protein [Massilia sp. CCM 9029]